MTRKVGNVILTNRGTRRVIFMETAPFESRLD
jgi:hypothetical protein